MDNIIQSKEKENKQTKNNSRRTSKAVNMQFDSAINKDGNNGNNFSRNGTNGGAKHCEH